MRVMGELLSWFPALAPLAVSHPRLAMGRYAPAAVYRTGACPY